MYWTALILIGVFFALITEVVHYLLSNLEEKRNFKTIKDIKGYHKRILPVNYAHRSLSYYSLVLIIMGLIATRLESSWLLVGYTLFVVGIISSFSVVLMILKEMATPVLVRVASTVSKICFGSGWIALIISVIMLDK